MKPAMANIADSAGTMILKLDDHDEEKVRT
jgi:hypothetical protein